MEMIVATIYINNLNSCFMVYFCLQIYHPYRQRPLRREEDWTNPCKDNGGCAEGTLCLIKPLGQGRVCACPEHHYPSTDKLRCIANCTR